MRLVRPLLLHSFMSKSSFRIARGTLLAATLLASPLTRASAQDGTPPPPTPDAAFVLSDGRLHATDGHTNDLDVGCRALALETSGARLYVACDERRVVLLDTSASIAPRIVGDIVLEAGFVSFFERDGAPWVELADGRALALERATVRLVAPASSGASSTNGHTVATHGRTVVVDLGSAQGISTGAHVEFVEDVDASLAGGPVERQTRRVAVGEVTAVTSTRSEVELGVNEDVGVGTAARPSTSPTTSSIVAPARVGGLWQLAIEARPYLTVGDLGVGILVDANATYRGTGPWFARASMDPSGAVMVRGETTGTQAQGSLLGGLDMRFLELGLGVGMLRYQSYESSCTTSSCSETLSTTPSFGLALSARLGALDGLHVRATSLLALHDSRWAFGSVDVALQIPVARGAWLVLRGGTGTEAIGYSYATMAGRYLARGNGGSRSLFLTGGMGWVEGAYVESSYGGYRNYAEGLAFTLGAEYRL